MADSSFPTSESLRVRGLLFSAAAEGDYERLEYLCASHREDITRYFDDWRQVPEKYRNSQFAFEIYGRMLVAVAQFFAVNFGDTGLLKDLTGPAEFSHLAAWEERIREVRSLMESVRYQEARAVLADLSDEVGKSTGSGSDRTLSTACGLIGECYFQEGQAEQAIEHTKKALHYAQRRNDIEDVVTYLTGLYEICRYLGRTGAAADMAARLAQLLLERGKDSEAARYRKQARLVRADEPLNRVVVMIDDHRYELDELPQAEVGEVQVLFERNRVSLRSSLVLTEEGITLAQEGRYDEALELFKDAGKADRFNPAPKYQEGFSLLHLRRYREAAEAFQATEALAPGWFHCRSFLWMARQLARGNIDHRIFVFLRMLEDGPAPLPDKVREAQRVLAMGFEYPLLYLLHGEHLLGLKRTEEAGEMFRKGLAVAIEPEVRSRLLVNLAFVQESQAEKKRLLRAVVKIDGNLFAQAVATLALQDEA